MGNRTFPAIGPPRQARVRRRNGGSRKIGTKAARSNKSTSTGKRSWKWTRRLCPQMRSSKGKKKVGGEDFAKTRENWVFLKEKLFCGKRAKRFLGPAPQGGEGGLGPGFK